MLATQHGMVITSPNMDFVPDLRHYQDEEVKARADGRFGLIDPFQWPQMYSARHWWSVAIPRPRTVSQIEMAWFTPTPTDFVSLPDADVGHLSPQIIDKLDHLVVTIRYRRATLPSSKHDEMATFFATRLYNSFDILCRQPFTFRDILLMTTSMQRRFLDAYALFEYLEIAEPRITQGKTMNPLLDTWMGAFTTDVNLANEWYKVSTMP
jgi:hypothetical protein